MDISDFKLTHQLIPLDHGTYGNTFASTLVTKTTMDDEGCRLQVESIIEVSILKHLNLCSRSFRSKKLRYHPFPTLYSCEVKDNLTSINMNYVGVTLSSIIVRDPQPATRLVKLMEEHLIKLLDCVKLMHQFGVIHGDLHLGNVTIDCSDRIHIIDFGFSCIGGMNHDILGAVPGSNKIPSADLWKLAASIVIYCKGGDRVYPDREWALDELITAHPHLDKNEIEQALIEGRSYLHPDGTELDLIIPIPKIIPRSLRQQLQVMLAVDPKNRHYEVEPVSIPSLNRWPISVNDESYPRLFLLLLDFMLDAYTLINKMFVDDMAISCTSVGVAIEIMHRIISKIGPLEDKNQLNGLMLGAITLSIDDKISLDDVAKWTHNLPGNHDLIHYQTRVLKLTNWKIFTHYNTVLRGTDITALSKSIRADENRGSYILLSTAELMEKLKSHNQ